jgi:hypothetical protein
MVAIPVETGAIPTTTTEPQVVVYKGDAKYLT